MAVSSLDFSANLKLHPLSAGGIDVRVRTRLRMIAQGEFETEFAVEGHTDKIKWPAQEGAERRDNLWRSTCFEAFITTMDDARYWELNFSPASHWAAYGFSAYREDMTNADGDACVALAQKSAGRLDLQARFSIANLRESDPTTLRFNLCAILEEHDNTRSYWALAHAGEKPDFHSRVGFIAAVEEESEL